MNDFNISSFIKIMMEALATENTQEAAGRLLLDSIATLDCVNVDVIGKMISNLVKQSAEVHDSIKTASSKPEVIDGTVIYFNEHIIPKLNPHTFDDACLKIKELLKTAPLVSPNKLKELETLYTANNLSNFFAMSFLYAINRVNRPQKIIILNPSLSSTYYQDGKIHIDGQTIPLPVELMPSNNIETHELPYIEALYEAYSDKLNCTIDSKDAIDTLSERYKVHFSSQRKAYYHAESIQRSVQEIVDDGKSQFDILKDEAYDGVEDTYWNEYSDGFERLTAVLNKITNTTLDQSALVNIKNLIGNSVKKGICHIMVNDDRIKSWVNIDE